MKALLTIGYYLLAFCALTIGLFLVLLHFNLLPGYEIRIVQSGSMEPAVPVGSLVLIKPVDRYQVDEIITFGDDSSNSLPTTHRIIGDSIIAGELVYTTKGDANEQADIEPVSEADIRGKVVLTIPYIGFILDFARQPLGFILLIGIPAFLIVIEEISTIYKAIFARKEELTSEQNPTEKSDKQDT